MKRIANRLARLTILPLLLCAVALSGCERFTPPEPDRFPLTAEQKLADFEQFYDTLLTSYPNFDDAAALFGVDFRARHDYYQRLVEGAETDFSYFCVLNAIEEDVPSFHTDMMLPFYEDIRDLGGYNLRAVLARRDLRESMDYWYDCLEEGCEELADVGFMSFKYIDGGYLYDPLYSEPAYDTYGGYSVTAVDGADITDYAVSNVSCDELKYDYPRGTPYRYFVTFNDAVGTPVTLTLEDPQGNTETLTLFASIEAETVSYYAYLFYDYGDEDDDKRDDGEDSDDWDDSVYSYVDEARGVTFVAVCDLDNEEGETLAAILTEAVARGGDLIIDLRSNGGGYTSYTAEYIYAPLYGETFTREYSWYMPDSVYNHPLIGDMQVRRAYDREDADGGFVFSDSIVLTGDGAADPARVYYLVNNATGSAADELAALVKSRGLGRLLGDNTAGEGLAGSYCAASLENSGLVFTYFPGRPLLPEGTRDAVRGVFPDEYIPQTRESFYAQRAMILDGEDTYSYEGLLRYDTLLLEALRQIEAARQRHD